MSIPNNEEEESMYIRTIPLVAESGYVTNDAVLPAEATSLMKVSCNNGFTQGNTIGAIVVRQLA